MTMKTWGARPLPRAEINFYGATLRVRQPTLASLRSVMEAAKQPGPEMLDAVVAFIRSCVDPPDREQWDKLVNDPDIDIDLADVADLMNWLMAGGQDPLGRSIGRSGNGATSPAPSSSAASMSDIVKQMTQI